ncbi:carbohydrate ABC transporter permease [Brachybacterium sp.]|uniref:carbohydrate ABC transporter permease n=1 Tax=Brachybacterium sp. TaxID=1891286 RepID=UPI003F8F9D15
MTTGAALSDTPSTSTPPRKRKAPSWSARTFPSTPSGWMALLLCSMGALIMLVPAYVIISTALSGESGAPGFFLTFPDAPSLQAFGTAFQELRGSLLNSIQITIPGAIITSLIGSFNGFLLAKLRFRGADLLFTLILVGMFIPFQAIIIPMFQFLQAIGLQGSLAGLLLVHVVYGIPITTLIFRNYYSAVPDATLEAASLDGCGIWRTYTRIILPLSIPGFVVAGIFQTTNIWNDFLFGFIFASPAARPATVTLNNLIGTTTVDYSVLMAGAVLVALPTVLVYLLLGKYFVRGLTAGAVK